MSFLSLERLQHRDLEESLQGKACSVALRGCLQESVQVIAGPVGAEILVDENKREVLR